MQSEISKIRTLSDARIPDHAVVVCDRNVSHFVPAGLKASLVEVDGGETLKSLSAIEELAARVLEIRATRPMTIIAIGGGSVGDAVGFLASILWRGVALWHVPTTLLAAVDSAHGGKTAVNLAERKNQLGTFWTADHVLLVEDILSSLPINLRFEGMTELVKGLWLGAPSALDALDEIGVASLCRRPWTEVGTHLLQLIDSAIAVKLDIVERDPREELGVRTVLNLGHTAAHAIELHDKLSHGRAVAWGMAAAALLSHRHRGLSTQDTHAMLRHVVPLLGPDAPKVSRRDFEHAVRGDKKRVDGELRSVLLDGPGEPVVVRDISGAQWYDAIQDIARTVYDGLLHVYRAPHAQQATTQIELSSSKSELNRILAISWLRPGATAVEGHSQADDVCHMKSALAAFDEDEIADAGSGGTTFRFLVALAATGRKPRRIRVSKQLASRPHDPLFAAIRETGGRVWWYAPEVVEIQPCPTGSLDFTIDSTDSSQFASALALVSAAGRRVQLRVPDALPSRGYFGMTLEFLRRAGVQVSREGRDYRLTPTDHLYTEATLRAAPDASSAAFWAVAAKLGVDVSIVGIEGASLQPDAAIHDYLWEPTHSDDIELSMTDAPDLVPVLAAYAALTAPAVRLVDAEHLRLKESNRIEDLAEAFADVGVEIIPLTDGVALSAGVQTPLENHKMRTFGDHRIAMAGGLLAMRAPIYIDSPRVVTKSYPELWTDLSALGWTVEPHFEF